MTIDYRRLARAFGGSGGQPRPRNSTTGAAQPEASEARTSPAALPGDDVAPPPLRMMPESTPTPAPVVVSAVDALLAALDAAGSDMERGYLLESTSVTVREELAGMLAYRAMTATPPSVG